MEFLASSSERSDSDDRIDLPADWWARDVVTFSEKGAGYAEPVEFLARRLAEAEYATKPVVLATPIYLASASV